MQIVRAAPEIPHKIRLFETQENTVRYRAEYRQLAGNNPMVGATVACAVAVEEAGK